MTESKIKLTLATRTMLLHAQRHWPEHINIMLWPVALLAAADHMNNLHIDIESNLPEITFFKVSGGTVRVGNFYTGGYQKYVLDSRLQDAGRLGPPKWDTCSRLGKYLGYLPSYAGSVALVLNPKTGLVSPQFHSVFDNDFSTVPNLQVGSMPENWKVLV